MSYGSLEISKNLLQKSIKSEANLDNIAKISRESITRLLANLVMNSKINLISTLPKSINELQPYFSIEKEKCI